MHKALKWAGIVLAATAVLLSLLLTHALWPPPVDAAPDKGFTLQNVVLIEPGLGRSALVDVSVAGGSITGIEPATKTSQPVRYVIPGLTDMHAHPSPLPVPGDDAYMSLLFLRHGVTTVRLLGGAAPDTTQQLNGEISGGKLPGPRYFTCGPIIDGDPPVLPGAEVVRNAAEARTLAEHLVADGADCLKAYDRLTAESLDVLRDVSRSRNVALVGHVPQALDFLNVHLDDAQHLRGVHPPFDAEPKTYPGFLAAWQRFDDQRLNAVVDHSLRNKIAHTPTLVAVTATLRAKHWPEFRSSPEVQLWPPHLRDGLWSGDVGFNPARFSSPEDFDTVRQASEQMKVAVRRLHEAGVAIHTGTDANAANVVPGASLHRELALLHEAGLSAEEALEASTARSAAFLGLANAGRLSIGSRADLVVLEADPTINLRALQSILGVAADGRYYETSRLNTSILIHRQQYERWTYRWIYLPLVRGSLSALTGALSSSQPDPDTRT